jgi:hypothetical protein
MLQDLGRFLRYARNLPPFLARRLTSEECRRRLVAALHAREANFLSVLEKAVYGHPQSPYRALLLHAGLGVEDVGRMVQQHGLEGALGRLHDAGVYVSLDEFKCRRPIVRPGLHLEPKRSDFDNPLLASAFEARTGGSRGAGARLLIDFGLLEHEAAYTSLFLEAFQAGERPMALWRPVPPAVAGIKDALRQAKVGARTDRWFSQNAFRPRARALAFYVFTAYTVYASQLFRNRLPVPRYVPVSEALEIARWLAEMTGRGTPALVDTVPSSALRVCAAAREAGMDIAGTLFRCGGEPLTATRFQAITRAECRAVSRYSMAEVGTIGLPCASPVVVDDVHLVDEKLAIVQRHRSLGTDVEAVGALFYTTVLPACPKIMLNTESGDYAILEQRDCGCLLEHVGLRRHLHTIRSYEKLTSEGMSFLGSELIHLIEEALPARFGGDATSYQLVETEREASLPTVDILVSPRLGAVDEEALRALVVRTLGSVSAGNRMMAERWQDAGTLRVVRREPYTSSVAMKVQPLHIARRPGIGRPTG